MKKQTSKILIILLICCLSLGGVLPFPSRTAADNETTTASSTLSNLLINPGFESYSGSNGVADGWWTYVSGGNAEFSVVQASVQEGNSAQKINGSGIHAGNVLMLYQDVNVQPGVPYTMSGQFDVEALERSQAELYVEFYDADGGWKGYNQAAQGAATGGYVPLSAAGVIPADAVRGRMYAILRAMDEDASGTFTVDAMSFSANVDAAAPSVVSSVPAENEGNVSRDQAIKVIFDEAVQAGEFFSQIALTASSGSAAAIAASVNGNELTVTPSANLEPGATYTLNVPAGAVRNGVGSSSAQAYVLTFQTTANLLVNSGFESYSGSNGLADGWWTYVSGGNAEFSVVQAPVQEGNSAQKINGSGIPAGNVLMLYQDVNVQPGVPYTMSGQFHVEALERSQAELYIEFYDADGGWKGYNQAAQGAVTGNYVPLSAVGVIPADVVRGRMYVILRAMDEDASGTFAADNLKFSLEADIDTESPTAPADLTAVTLSSSEANLNWTASQDNRGVSEYQIFRDSALVGTVPGTVTTFTMSGLEFETIYSFHIVAKDWVGNASGMSNIIQFSLNPVRDDEPPAAPTDLTVTETTYSSITLSWNASTDNQGVSTYKIYSGNTLIEEVDSAALSFRVTGLTENTAYSFSVMAKDFAGNESVKSNSVSAVTRLWLQPSIQLAMGLDFTFAQKSDGSVWAWGNGSRLGIETVENQLEPVKVSSLQSTYALAAGHYHSLAIQNDGTVWAWGQNNYGQLGTGTTEDSVLPVKVPSLDNVIAVASGRFLSVALKSDGTVWTWGYNNYGQLGNGTLSDSLVPTQVPGLSGIKAISAKFHSVLALGEDGQVWSWGENTLGQLGDGTTTDRTTPVQVVGLEEIKEIAISEYFGLALKSDGTIWAWGANSYGQLGDGTFNSHSSPVKVSSIESIQSIAVGVSHSLALKKDGSVWSWGYNSSGELGLGDIANTSKLNVPTKIPKLEGIASISAGRNSSGAVSKNGVFYTWGINRRGLLGNGNQSPSSKPIRVIGTNLNPIDNSAPTSPVLTGIRELGAIQLSWSPSIDNERVVEYKIYNGNEFVGRVTHGGTSFRVEGILENTMYSFTVTALDDSGNESVASNVFAGSTDTVPPEAPGHLMELERTADSVLLTWTASSDNIGVAAYDVYNGSQLVGSVSPESTEYNAEDLLPNMQHTFTVKARDASGNVSEASNSVVFFADLQAPSQPSNLQVTAAQPGKLQLSWDEATDNVGTIGYDVYSNSTLIGSVAGNVTSFLTPGLNVNIEYVFAIIARDAAGNISVPSESKTGVIKVSAISLGNDFMIALKPDGTVWSWGLNVSGQLGDGSTLSSSFPRKVLGLSNIVAVSAGYSHSLALKSDGTVYAWGNNPNGTIIGHGFIGNQTVPIQIPGLDDVVAIAAGQYYSLILKSNGTVWSWGLNMYTQLGDGTTNNHVAPVQVQQLNEIVAISTTRTHSLALQNDGTVWAWGRNNSGQLGNGNKNNQSVPMQVVSISDAVAVSAGNSFSLVLKNDGTVWSFGNNQQGQLGDGTTVSKSIAVKVAQLDQVTQISAGGYQGLAMKNDGSVWSWGGNGGGQLGIGTLLNQNIPQQVQLPNAASVIATGNSNGGFLSSSSAAIDAQGLYYTWGENYEGQLGNGTEIKSSTPIQVIGPNVNPIDIEAPSPPTQLQVIHLDGTNALSWSASTDNVGVSEYYIYMNDILIDVVVYNDFPAYSEKLTYSLLNIELGEESIFTVRAKDVTGNLSYTSNAVSKIIDTEPPTAPGNLRVTSMIGTEISISWEASIDNVGLKEYLIYSGSELVGSVGGEQIAFALSNATPNTIYSLSVVGKDTSGNVSSASNVVSTVIDTLSPTAPKKLTVAAKTSTTISLTWTEATDNVGVVSYKVYNGNTYVGSSATNGFVVQGVGANALYNLKVTAVDAAGNESQLSNELYLYSGNYEYVYDVAGRVDYIQLTTSQKLKYFYDANGNLLKIEIQ